MIVREEIEREIASVHFYDTITLLVLRADISVTHDR